MFNKFYFIVFTLSLFIVLGNKTFSQSGSQTFTSSGNFIVPENVTSVTIELVGAGGSGGGNGGGGGGGYAKGVYAVVPLTNYTVTVGTAGGGASGGTTSVGNLISATGGENGYTVSNPNLGGGGVGGVGSNGTIANRIGGTGGGYWTYFGGGGGGAAGSVSDGFVGGNTITWTGNCVTPGGEGGLDGGAPGGAGGKGAGFTDVNCNITDPAGNGENYGGGGGGGNGNGGIPGTGTGGYVLISWDIIPVELSAFSANVADGNVVLNWTTETELNNQEFVVERRISESQFITIGNVQGNGTTTERKYYSFIDASVEPGKYFYRLKQVDFDGSFEYSNQVYAELTAPLEFALNQNYPNPFNPTTSINFSLAEPTFVKLAVYDLLGEEVQLLKNEYMNAGSFNITFDAASFPNGMYLYKIETAQFTSVRKMLLMK